jgi:uncharacterized membrane protein
MYIIKILVVLLLFACLSNDFAHEGHKHEEKADTATVVNGDTIAINGIANEKYLATKYEKADHDEDGEVEEITFGSIFEHMHNKLVHFPIALSVIALFLLIVGGKENKYLGAIRIIVSFAAVFSVVTVITGILQIGPFVGTPTFELVKVHRLLGFGVLASLILWTISLYVNRFNKFVYFFAILTFLLVTVTGLYGGVIAH